jgi:hypothetical protein
LLTVFAACHALHAVTAIRPNILRYVTNQAQRANNGKLAV